MTTANNKRKKAMAGTVRARVGRGVLELLEKVDLPEGKEVSVTILDVPSTTDKEAFRRAAGGWKGTVDAEALIKNIYADRLIPTRPVPKL
jgi:predicted DNA-binding antitoxin AbrB/MazE fold protein